MHTKQNEEKVSSFGRIIYVAFVASVQSIIVLFDLWTLILVKEQERCLKNFHVNGWISLLLTCGYDTTVPVQLGEFFSHFPKTMSILLLLIR